MRKYFIYPFILFCCLTIFFSCSDKNESETNVIIAIPSDATTFNPMFAFNVNEGRISELIYLGLIEHKWDSNLGNLSNDLMLAKSIKWSDDSLSLLIDLREDVYWSDSIRFDADDVVFTFGIYSDANVRSKFYGMFKNFYLNEDLSIDLEKSFEILSPYKIKINFNKNSVPTLMDIGYPILPKHIFAEIPKNELAKAEANIKPVGTGPYKLTVWEKNQSIRLVANKNSFNKNKIIQWVHNVIYRFQAEYCK